MCAKYNGTGAGVRLFQEVPSKDWKISAREKQAQLNTGGLVLISTAWTIILHAKMFLPGAESQRSINVYDLLGKNIF